MRQTNHISTGAIECRVHVSQLTVWSILNEEPLHQFYTQIVQLCKQVITLSAQNSANGSCSSVCCSRMSQLICNSQMMRFLHRKVFSVCVMLMCGPQKILTCYTSTCMPKALLCKCFGGYCERFFHRHVFPPTRISKSFSRVIVFFWKKFYQNYCRMFRLSFEIKSGFSMVVRHLSGCPLIPVCQFCEMMVWAWWTSTVATPFARFIQHLFYMPI